MGNTFVCDMCGGTFDKAWSDEDAIAELKEVWGDIDPEECHQVCDDCWELVHPKNNEKLFKEWQDITNSKTEH